MCGGDRPVAPTGVGGGDQPGCADREHRPGAPAFVSKHNFLPLREKVRVKETPPKGFASRRCMPESVHFQCSMRNEMVLHLRAAPETYVNERAAMVDKCIPLVLFRSSQQEHT